MNMQKMVNLNGLGKSAVFFDSHEPWHRRQKISTDIFQILRYNRNINNNYFREYMIQRAFFLKPQWLALVLSGEKSWELRTTATSIREQVGIIEKSSGTVVGICTIVACHGPLTDDELAASYSKHLTTPLDRQRLAGARPYRYAWVVDHVQALRVPVPYVHIPGTQGWCGITTDVAAEIARQERLGEGQPYDIALEH